MENSLISDALWTSRICLYVVCCHFIHLYVTVLRPCFLLEIFPHRVSLHTTLFFLHPLPRETNIQVGYSTFQVQVAFNDITQKIPKKILTKFSYPKDSWNQNFETPKNPLIIPALEIWSTPPGPTSIIILFLTIPISIRRKCSGSRKTAWIFHQILSTNSLRKCQEINVEFCALILGLSELRCTLLGLGT